MISETDLQKVFEYMNNNFKDYKGCANCKYQPEPLRMCDWGAKRNRVELVCIGWEKKDE